MRMIDADALKKAVNGISTHWLNDWSTIGVLSIIDKQPTVDAVERKRGRWEQVANDDNGIDFRCSVCHRYRFHNGEMLRKYRFCPNCGADMRKGEEE